MTTADYIQLRDQLKAIKHKGLSEGENFSLSTQVTDAIKHSGLYADEKTDLLSAAGKAANPSGWYCTESGATPVIELLNNAINMEVAA